ncbi:TrmH family RNA methyltransferase [Methylocapsa acidiphila]|uniref:TrmH family RNA methyltransferase n=1 Tax=Methylocapsa acidiphila TaxID=133552 RepID=UPI000560F64C|nr:RNA methyltransferase [Methylocapsa acidiphila]
MTRDAAKGSGRKGGASPRRAAPPGRGPRPAAASEGKPRPQPAKKAPRPTEGPEQGQTPSFRRPAAELVALFGFHAVREALRVKRRKLLDIYATQAAADRLEGEIANAGLRPHIVQPEDLTHRLGATAAHQGLMLEARPLEPIDLSEISSRSGVVLVLDQITDPHNVGAILRTAAAFGVDALVTTERHAPEMAGVLAKAASGGLEHVDVVAVVNLSRALQELGEMGYQRIGLDSEAPVDFAELRLRRPVALALGGEGKGLRRLTKENCDDLARLDMPGPIKSLNVSNACAVALTLTLRRLGI